MTTPDHLYYSQEHVWVAVDGDQARLGMTHHAQQHLGETMFLEFCTPIPGDAPAVRAVTVGTELATAQVFVALEGTYESRDIPTPISGRVTAVNEDLMDDPGAIDRDPYGTWLVTLALPDAAELGGLLTADAYAERASND